MSPKTAQFRFYEELNDYLPAARQKKTFDFSFEGTSSVKDAIESLGVPHIDIDLIVVNSESVGFDYKLKNGDRVAVYPVFEALDISEVIHLRKKPLRQTKFILDLHLGKLARLLRLLGFDTLYKNNYADCEIVRLAREKKRIILTRDRNILKYKDVTHGYWIRSQNPDKQLTEVIERFDLKRQIKPFSRCLVCNGLLKKVEKKKIVDRLKPRTRRYFDEFYRCRNCQKIYWKGSHYEKMQAYLKNHVKS